MHMSDALLSPSVGGVFAATSGGLLAWSARRFGRSVDQARLVPLAGVLGAFVFAGQMLNFAIPGTGSSGHIGGGLLLAILLGPYTGFLTLAAVLVVQCLFFMDGGLLALGANIFNLGFWPCFVGLPLYRLLTGTAPSDRRRLMAAVAAAVAALEPGALGVALQTVLSGRSELPLAAFAPLMLLIHLPIGVVEGLMTAGVLQFVARHRPEVLAAGAEATEPAVTGTVGARLRPLLLPLAGAALFMAGVLAWFASAHPDGLEWAVARTTGQEELEHEPGRLAAALARAQERLALFPDYAPRAAPDAAAPAAPEDDAAWPAISGGGSLAGVAGAVATGLIIGAMGLLLQRLHARPAPSAAPPPAPS
jgi:cobalt/nickel transport system permease protein